MEDNLGCFPLRDQRGPSQCFDSCHWWMHERSLNSHSDPFDQCDEHLKEGRNEEKERKKEKEGEGRKERKRTGERLPRGEEPSLSLRVVRHSLRPLRAAARASLLLFPPSLIIQSSMLDGISKLTTCITWEQRETTTNGKKKRKRTIQKKKRWKNKSKRIWMTLLGFGLHLQPEDKKKELHKSKRNERKA